MKKTLTALAILMAVPAGTALAGDDCSVLRAEWQSMEAVSRLSAENGWTLRKIEVDDGCYEVEARTGDGRRIEAKLNPKTLEVIEIKERKEGGGRRKPDPVPAGSITAPANGLFGTGTPPKVQVN